MDLSELLNQPLKTWCTHGRRGELLFSKGISVVSPEALFEANFHTPMRWGSKVIAKTNIYEEALVTILKTTMLKNTGASNFGGIMKLHRSGTAVKLLL